MWMPEAGTHDRILGLNQRCSQLMLLAGATDAEPAVSKPSTRRWLVLERSLLVWAAVASTSLQQ